MVQITDLKTYITCPDGINLVVVRVETNQPGLFGLGCATFTQRCKAVVTVIEEYLKPLLVGRDATESQELWTLMYHNAYWRNGPVLNNAIGGVDLALWDIKGKLAGMPVYNLLGGKARTGVTLYRYANGDSREEILEGAQKLWEDGYHHIRLQYFPMRGYPPMQREWKPKGAKDGFYQDPHAYMEEIIGLFDYVRSKMGFQPELIHDVHERLPAIDAVQLAKELEPMKLFFLEDLFAPDQTEYYRMVRNLCTTPVAHGELCINPLEWREIVTERLIDFIRVHITMLGGLTPALKCAHVCETFNVRTAWHGPTDMNPIGHTAQMHLDLTCTNFGIQEWPGFSDAMSEVFHGIPEIRKGYAYVNDKPGFGIEFDEEKSKKYPHKAEVTSWTQFRLTDGGLYTP